MAIYIALLRGINVSGHRPIKMADLRAMCEALGLRQVQTYIQSGNVLFEGAGEAEEVLRRRFEREIEARFGFDVPVALRTAGEWQELIDRCPYPADRLAEGESLHISLLAEKPSQEGLDRLAAAAGGGGGRGLGDSGAGSGSWSGAGALGGDEFRLIGREIYILCRQPVHKSKLTNQFFEQKLQVPSTQRNWQTVQKLAGLARAMEEAHS